MRTLSILLIEEDRTTSMGWWHTLAQTHGMRVIEEAIGLAPHDVRVMGAGHEPIVSTEQARRLIEVVVNASPPLAPPADAVPCVLSAREQEVLQLCSRGFSHHEIAHLMAVSPHTVNSFVKRIYRKMQVHSKTEAVFEGRRLGWVD